MTFQEAYEKTRRVLNVIIPFEGGKRSVLMNFLTTPNVVRLNYFLMVNLSLYGLPLWRVILKEVFLVSGAMSGFSAKMKLGISFHGIATVSSTTIGANSLQSDKTHTHLALMNPFLKSISLVYCLNLSGTSHLPGSQLHSI